MLTASTWHVVTGPYRAYTAITRQTRTTNPRLVNNHLIDYHQTGATCTCGARWADTPHLHLGVAGHLAATRTPGAWIHPDTLRLTS